LRFSDIGIYSGVAPNEITKSRNTEISKWKSNWEILRFSDIGIFLGIAAKEITKSRNTQISNTLQIVITINLYKLSLAYHR
jgi:hypothetical protein